MGRFTFFVNEMKNQKKNSVKDKVQKSKVNVHFPKINLKKKIFF